MLTKRLPKTSTRRAGEGRWFDRRLRRAAAVGAALIFVGLMGACQPPIMVHISVPGPASITTDSSAAPVVSAGPTPPADLRPATPAMGGATPLPTAPATPTLASTRPAPASVPPDRIVAPAIGLDSPVVDMGWTIGANGKGSEWQIPENAAGFHDGSALPGNPGNSVISGHHNVKGQVFARVYQLKPGDVIDLSAGGQIYHYQVEDSFIIPELNVPDEQRRQNTRWIEPTADERLTLVTCWPAGGNSHRVIVIARPK